MNSTYTVDLHSDSRGQRTIKVTRCDEQSGKTWTAVFGGPFAPDDPLAETHCNLYSAALRRDPAAALAAMRETWLAEQDYMAYEVFLGLDETEPGLASLPQDL